MSWRSRLRVSRSEPPAVVSRPVGELRPGERVLVPAGPGRRARVATVAAVQARLGGLVVITWAEGGCATAYDAALVQVLTDPVGRARWAGCLDPDQPPRGGGAR